MKRFIAMHSTECGFPSVEETREWIAATQDDPLQWRVVEIKNDPATAVLANQELQAEIEKAYVAGREAAKAEFRARLGL